MDHKKGGAYEIEMDENLLEYKDWEKCVLFYKNVYINK